MKNEVKVLVFEDQERDLQLLKETLLLQNMEIVGVASNLKEGMKLLHQVDFDIALLDIFVEGEPKGIAFANEIGNEKPFIFITSSLEASIFQHAKNTNPHNYLIKPYNPLELLFAIELAIEKVVAKEGAFAQKIPVHYNDAIFVKKNKALIKINRKDIYAISVEGQYCQLKTDEDTFLVHTSLTQLLEEFPDNQFVRVHRNTAISPEKIKMVYPDDHLIILTNGEKVMLSRKYKAAFIKNYRIFK